MRQRDGCFLFTKIRIYTHMKESRPKTLQLIYASHDPYCRVNYDKNNSSMTSTFHSFVISGVVFVELSGGAKGNTCTSQAAAIRLVFARARRFPVRINQFMMMSWF